MKSEHRIPKTRSELLRYLQSISRIQFEMHDLHNRKDIDAVSRILKRDTARQSATVIVIRHS